MGKKLLNTDFYFLILVSTVTELNTVENGTWGRENE